MARQKPINTPNNLVSKTSQKRNPRSTYRNTKQPRIRRRLIHPLPLRPIHPHHLKPAPHRIPMKNPLHPRPSTPPYAPPTRPRSARTTPAYPNHVQIRPVHPRLSTACIPAPFRTGEGDATALVLRVRLARPPSFRRLWTRRSTPAIAIALAAIQNTTSVSPPSTDPGADPETFTRSSC